MKAAPVFRLLYALLLFLPAAHQPPAEASLPRAGVLAPGDSCGELHTIDPAHESDALTVTGPLPAIISELTPALLAGALDVHQGGGLLVTEPRRGPPAREPETRIGAFEHPGASLIGAEAFSNPHEQLGHGVSWLEIAEGEHPARNNPLKYVDRDGRDFQDFMLGMGNALSSNHFFGVNRMQFQNSDSVRGQIVGDAVSAILGPLEMFTGGAAAAAGGGLALSGCGAVASPAMIAGGVGLASTGASAMVNGIMNLFAASSEGGGAAERTPDPQEYLTKDVLSQSRVIAVGEKIRDVRRLVEQYGGKARDWVKKSSPILEIEGRAAEIHWYENRGVGKVNQKIVYLDER